MPHHLTPKQRHVYECWHGGFSYRGIPEPAATDMFASMPESVDLMQLFERLIHTKNRLSIEINSVPHLAFLSGNLEWIEKVLAYPELTANDPANVPYAIFAAFGGLEGLKLVLNKFHNGGFLNVRSPSRLSVLHAAAYHDRVDCLQWLLEASTKMNANNLFVFAVMGGADKCLDLLLTHFKPTNLTEIKLGNQSLLEAAVRRFSRRCVKLLLSYCPELQNVAMSQNMTLATLCKEYGIDLADILHQIEDPIGYALQRRAAWSESSRQDGSDENQVSNVGSCSSTSDESTEPQMHTPEELNLSELLVDLGNNPVQAPVSRKRPVEDDAQLLLSLESQTPKRRGMITSKSADQLNSQIKRRSNRLAAIDHEIETAAGLLFYKPAARQENDVPDHSQINILHLK